MLTGFARQLDLLLLPKAGHRFGLSMLLLLGGVSSVPDATALNDTRTLTFHHTHSGEDLTVTFKRDGRFDEEALKQLNHFLRDWRTQDQTTMDPHLFDIIWEVYRDVDGKKPIQIISAYRAPETNAMLRRRSAHSGVARFSQHMLGHAMDFYIPDVPLEQIRYAGLRVQRGGVGFYPTSGSPFVHLDTGNIRHWPRMTHDQLARVFPDGRTVHIPTDGVPLKGYEMARADIDRRGDGDSASKTGRAGLMARLFGTKSDDEEDESSAPAVQDKAAAAPQARTADATPKLRARPPGTTLQLAAADVQTAQPAKPKQASSGEASEAKAAEAKAETPLDIINARGFWDGMPAAPNQATPAQVASLKARQALSQTDPQSTGSIPAAYQAMAYAPEASRSDDRANSRGARATSANHSAAANDPATVAAKAQDSMVAASTRVTSAADNAWTRMMMLAPSARTSMSVTMLGDPNMTVLNKLFAKPQIVIVMGLSDDAQVGPDTDHFTGAALAPLPTRSFALRTASLR